MHTEMFPELKQNVEIAYVLNRHYDIVDVEHDMTDFHSICTLSDVDT